METTILNQTTRRRLAEVETLWNISQIISIETDTDRLFQVIHDQVIRVLGEISSFAIALFDPLTQQVRIPYLVEEKQYLNIPPFPLGEGLSSIVIRTGRPLLLVQDVEVKAVALGAKIKGAPAKSWLGVPMQLGGENIGVIIVQDSSHENRFTEDDQRLLSTIASHVAVVIRNAQLLKDAHRHAETAKKLNEITDRIRRAVDIQSILKITAEELGATLKARRIQVKISLQRSQDRLT
jgi:GAF domain-containing protein